MNNAKKELCRFCLKTIRDEDFDIIGKITLEILDALLIEMDLNIDGRSLMCCDCQASIERCFNFKRACISSEDGIVKYISEGSKLDLEDVYLKKQLRPKSVNIPQGHKICRLCMRTSETAKYMNNTDKVVTLSKDILHKFIPEVNLNAVKNPVICETCLQELQSYSGFRTGCLDVEKKINRYCEVTGVAKRQVQLHNVLQFIINEAVECDIKEYAVPKNKGKLDANKSNIEINYCKELNTKEFHIKTEEIMFKSEEDIDSFSNKNINCNSKAGLINGGQAHFPGADQCNLHEDMNCDRNRIDMDTEEKPETPSLPKMVKEENIDGNQLELFTKHNGKESSSESIMERSVTEHDIKNEEIEIKSEDVEMRDNDDEVVGEKTKRHKLCCQLCTFRTTGRKVFDRHLLIHNTPAEVIVYKCDDCSFISKSKFGLKLHTTRIHEYPFTLQELKCKLCPYKSIYSSHIKVHELTHLPPSERQKFKCSVCDFRCVSKQYFKEHQQIHSVNSKPGWYRCTTCSYKTVHRASYKTHMQYHKLIPETKMFHCAHCPYKAKCKYTLRCHLRKHRNKSDVSPREHEFYKCETCNYVTTRKIYFKLHILRHKDKSELQIYRCDECSYETRQKYNIKFHKKNVHGDPFQIKTYKCEVCPFHGKTRGALNNHILTHKSFNEVPTYKCFHCSYQAKFKHSLIVHLQTHMDQSRRTKFKCEICGREVTSESNLRRHKSTCIRSHQMGVKRIGEN